MSLRPNVPIDHNFHLSFSTIHCFYSLCTDEWQYYGCGAPWFDVVIPAFSERDAVGIENTFPDGIFT